MTRLTEARVQAPDATLDEEVIFLTDSLADLQTRETTCTSKPLSTDRTKKSRGYRNRTQGRQWRGDAKPT